MNKEKKTSEEWDKIIDDGLIILDPNGWDRKNYQYSWYEELITKEEFFERKIFSTVATKRKKIVMNKKVLSFKECLFKYKDKFYLSIGLTFLKGKLTDGKDEYYPVVTYIAGDGYLYVRELDEFCEKFEKATYKNTDEMVYESNKQHLLWLFKNRKS